MCAEEIGDVWSVERLLAVGGLRGACGIGWVWWRLVRATSTAAVRAGMRGRVVVLGAPVASPLHAVPAVVVVVMAVGWVVRQGEGVSGRGLLTNGDC